LYSLKKLGIYNSIAQFERFTVPEEFFCFLYEYDKNQIELKIISKLNSPESCMEVSL